MIRYAMVAVLVMAFCCGVVVAQEVTAVPPRVTAPVRAAALARAAERTNAGLAGTRAPVAAAEQQADEGAGEEASAASADASEEAETGDDEQPARRQKKGRRGPSALEKVGQTAAVAIVAAIVTVGLIVLALGS